MVHRLARKLRLGLIRTTPANLRRLTAKVGRVGLRAVGGRAGLIIGGAAAVGGLVGRRLGRDGQPFRSKRINVLNQKALKRAIRRVEGFAKFASKAIVLKGSVALRKKRKPKIHLH